MSAYIVTADGRVPLSGRSTIGTTSDQSIRLADEYVSNRHAELVSMGEQWYISDAGSMNGVTVNEQRIYEYAPLRSGDQIRVGHTTLLFQQDAPEPPR